MRDQMQADGVLSYASNADPSGVTGLPDARAALDPFAFKKATTTAIRHPDKPTCTVT
jgi:hypothetical protein